MSRPRFLADHDLNEHIVTGVLRQEPVIEFHRVRDFGMSDQPDEVILDFAERELLLVGLVLIWAASELEDWKDQVVFLPLV